MALPPAIAEAYAVLEVEPGAPEDQIRRAYKRLVHQFSPESPVVYGLYTPGEAQALVARIESAWRTLSDAARHRPSRPTGRRSLNSTPTLPAVGDPLAGLGLPPDTALRGEVIARVRAAMGIGLDDIADRTKIGVFTLRCIETEAYGDLPATVYLKGFLKQIAAILRLDPQRLVRDYMAGFDAWTRDNRKRRFF